MCVGGGGGGDKARFERGKEELRERGNMDWRKREGGRTDGEKEESILQPNSAVTWIIGSLLYINPCFHRIAFPPLSLKHQKRLHRCPVNAPTFF